MKRRRGRDGDDKWGQVRGKKRGKALAGDLLWSAAAPAPTGRQWAGAREAANSANNRTIGL